MPYFDSQIFAMDGELMGVAHALADAARRAILPYFRSETLATENKLAGASAGVGGADRAGAASGAFDPVTEADRAAEQAMREVLAARRPNDTVVGEEYGTEQGTSGVQWVLDPIDGTRGFMSGTPTWGVLIAAGDENGPALGVIDQPYIGERFWGAAGSAHMRGPHGERAISVRGARPLSQSVLFTTFPEVGTPEEGAAFHAVADKVQLTRYGMDCYAYALLASGQIDLVIEAGLSNYDIQAPLAVIEAAGGIVTDWQGGPAHMGGRVLAAAGPEQHAAALEILSQV